MVGINTTIYGSTNRTVIAAPSASVLSAAKHQHQLQHSSSNISIKSNRKRTSTASVTSATIHQQPLLQSTSIISIKIISNSSSTAAATSSNKASAATLAKEHAQPKSISKSSRTAAVTSATKASATVVTCISAAVIPCILIFKLNQWDANMKRM